MKPLCLTNDMHNFCLPSVYKKKPFVSRHFSRYIVCLVLFLRAVLVFTVNLKAVSLLQA